MALRDVFRVGDRVRPSRKALKSGLWTHTRTPDGGVVVSESRSPLGVNVQWDHRKTHDTYYKGFVSHDGRAKKRRSRE